MCGEGGNRIRFVRVSCVSVNTIDLAIAFFLMVLIVYPTFASEDVAVQLSHRQSHGQAVSTHSAHIEQQALSHTSGLVSVNLTAGDGNVQQNSHAYASSDGFGRANIQSSQVTEAVTADFYQNLSARIEAGAFNGLLGVGMVNQSAGVGNVQFNGMAMAMGGLGSAAYIQLDGESLGAQSATTGAGLAIPVQTTTEVSVDPDAFRDARGVIMINQAVGNNNVTANSFTLSINP